MVGILYEEVKAKGRCVISIVIERQKKVKRPTVWKKKAKNQI